jgi:hypothetical protein
MHSSSLVMNGTRRWQQNILRTGMKTVCGKQQHSLQLQMIRSRDSSVGIVTGYKLDGRGSIPHKGDDFSLHQSVLTGSGAHQCVLSIGYQWLFPREVKRLVHQADHSPLPGAKVNSDGAIPPHPHMSSWH